MPRRKWGYAYFLFCSVFTSHLLLDKHIRLQLLTTLAGCPRRECVDMVVAVSLGPFLVCLIFDGLLATCTCFAIFFPCYFLLFYIANSISTHFLPTLIFLSSSFCSPIIIS
ncbi:hypothetical protein K435DRAFT_296901 [Dendrothele bispora CBS 962.96]|uniref:Uncharacterized protein n=1 Tax=Dendrothele bispora (strain CBS 962.96) TaxID=1314807 RepID=A0A4S8LIV4_DENBC|nr:hypothetical protein K435DRAFT_296901 [Dendrothele bispora CBS 962.96]